MDNLGPDINTVHMRFSLMQQDSLLQMADSWK